MKKLMVMIVGMFLISSTAFAKVCPKLWAQFDTDVKTTKAKALRVEGEKLHKAGTHDQSEKLLKDALKLIGSKA